MSEHKRAATAPATVTTAKNASPHPELEAVSFLVAAGGAATVVVVGLGADRGQQLGPQPPEGARQAGRALLVGSQLRPGPREGLRRQLVLCHGDRPAVVENRVPPPRGHVDGLPRLLHNLAQAEP